VVYFNFKVDMSFLSAESKRTNWSKLIHKIPKHNTHPPGGENKVRPHLAHWFYYIGYNCSLKSLKTSLKERCGPLYMDQKMKIHFYNSFQQCRATSVVLETSNLRIFGRVSSCFRTNLHKTTNKREQKKAKNTLRVSLVISV